MDDLLPTATLDNKERAKDDGLPSDSPAPGMIGPLPAEDAALISASNNPNNVDPLDSRSASGASQPDSGLATMGRESEPKLAVDTIPPTKPAASPTLQCYAPYQETNPDWAPGLPTAPADSTKALVTDFKNQYPDDPNLIFTHAYPDDFLAFIMEFAHRDVVPNQEESRIFSKEIRDVQVSTDTQKTGGVKVHIQLADGKGHTRIVDMRGQFKKFETVDYADTELTQVPIPGARNNVGSLYSGVLACFDVRSGCKNVVIRFDRLGKKKLSAMLLHHWGMARVTMDDKDRREYEHIENESYKEFAQVLANTLNNSCLSALAVANRKTQQQTCEKQILIAECGKQKLRTKALKSVGLSNWAVAYGRAGFRVSFSAPTYKVVIQGPLLMPSLHPKADTTLKVENFALKGIESGNLLNNDGNGNLNLQINFKDQLQDSVKGTSKNQSVAHMRLSISAEPPDRAQKAAQKNVNLSEPILSELSKAKN